MAPSDAERKMDLYLSIEPALTKTLARAMRWSMARMSQDSLRLAEAFERDKAFVTGPAREWLETIDITAGARIAERVDELVRLGLDEDTARDILSDMASHSAGYTRKQAYRAVLGIERAYLHQCLAAKAQPAIKETVKAAALYSQYERQKAVGIGWRPDRYPSRMVEAVLTHPADSRWLMLAKKQDGSKEVPRVWDRLTSVRRWLADVSSSTADNIYSVCVEGMMVGDHPTVTAKRLEEVRDTAPWRCRAMARTMVCETSGQTEMSIMGESGDEKYYYMATLEAERTCPVCGALDGRVFRVADAKVGLNYPPMHPNCRCTTAPVMDTDKTRMADMGLGQKAEYIERTTGQRAAYILDDKGRRRYVRVPASMTFAEWQKIDWQKFSEDFGQ